MKRRHRTFGTTADVGVVSTGRDIKEAFEEQAKGMFSIMADMRRVRAREPFVVEAEGLDEAGLLASWLEELLFLFETKGVLLKEFRIISVEGFKLKSEVRGEDIDTSRHVIKTPIKAVTYHMLEVTKAKGGVRTKVVYDI